MAQAAQILEMPKKKAPSPSFGEALAQTAKAAAPKAKKSSMPTINPPEEVAQAVDTYQEAKAAAKKAEADMGQAAETIMEFTRDRQDEDGYAGNYHGSYCLVGHSHQVKVIYANKYTLNPDDEAALREILGENFDTMLTKKFNVKLRDEVFQDEALQADLMALVGGRFGEFFETTASLQVTEDFTKNIYRAVPRDQVENLRLFARQYKPSLR